jgi:4-hydroxy-3-methylbut-2-en-1-yl diphosphate reductase
MKKIILSKPRGFCAGVVRAINTVEEALAKFGSPIYIKHEIVHNKHVVDDLKEKGAIFIEDLNEVPKNSYLIYSAHGVSPKVRQIAKTRNLIVIDATCPLVTKIHSALKRFASKGYKNVLIGKKKHVEIVGAYEEAPHSTTIVERVSDVEKLDINPDEKVFYVIQTTFSLDDVKDIIKALQEKFKNLETLPSSSICYATQNRQNALKHISQSSDLVLVIGDPKSSNSNRLCELAKKMGLAAYLINDEKEIKKDYLQDVNVIGITAGASTPEGVVQRCIEKLQKYENFEIKQEQYIEENIHFGLPSEVLV